MKDHKDIEVLEEQLDSLKMEVDDSENQEVINDFNELVDVFRETSESIDEDTKELNEFVNNSVVATKEKKDVNFLRETIKMRDNAVEEGQPQETIDKHNEIISEIMNSYSLGILKQHFTPNIKKELKKNPQKYSALSKKVLRKLGNTKKYSFPNPTMLPFHLKKILPDSHKQYTNLFLAHFYSYIMLAPMDRTAIFVQKSMSNIIFTAKTERTDYNEKFINNIVSVIDYLLEEE